MTKRMLCVALLLAAPRVASAQEVSPSPGVEAVPPPVEAPKPAEPPKTEPPKTEAPKAEAPKAEAPRAEAPKAPRFSFYFDPETGSYIKPVLGIAGGYAHEIQKNELDGVKEKLDPLNTTVAVVIFGLEGKIGRYTTFHTELRRDPGLFGTSVWEGTISLTAMDNYVKVERWGASLAGGIVTDPSSVDYFSTHIADLFLADNYTRTTLLHSGFNRGQGLLGQYNWRWFTVGFSATAGNPLATSTSFGFGGRVSPLGSLIEYPRRTIVNGNPQTGMELRVLSPSLLFQSEWVDAYANLQEYFVSVNTEADTDVPLHGWVLRGGLRGKIPLFGTTLVPFFNYASRRNEMLLQASASPDNSQLDPDPYKATVLSGGFDWNFLGRTGVGVNYGVVTAKTGTLPQSRHQFLNVGGTYWVTDNVSFGLRYARMVTSTDGQTDDGVKDKDAFFATIRLML